MKRKVSFEQRAAELRERMRAHAAQAKADQGRRAIAEVNRVARVKRLERTPKESTAAGRERFTRPFTETERKVLAAASMGRITAETGWQRLGISRRMFYRALLEYRRRHADPRFTPSAPSAWNLLAQMIEAGVAGNGARHVSK